MITTQPDPFDVQFDCARCTAKFLMWRQEVGQWRCRYHPGSVEYVSSGTESWRRYTCCGLFPEQSEVAPNVAFGSGIFVRAATEGCTRCDHTLACEALDVPARVFKQSVPGIPSGRARATRDAVVLAPLAADARLSDVYWKDYASLADRTALDDLVNARKSVAPHVLAIGSWLPRQSSIYDAPEKLMAELSASRLPDLVEMAKALARQEVQRVALGLRRDGRDGPDAELRAQLAPTVPDFEVLLVDRRAPLPTPDEVARNRRASERLFLLSHGRSAAAAD
jgi:hypothetical protein